MSFSLLLEITGKTSAVLLVALGMTRIMTLRSSAAARHLVWVLACGAMLILPPVVVFGPAWRVANLPERWLSADTRGGSAQRGNANGSREVWPAASTVNSHSPFVAEPGRTRPDSDNASRASVSILGRSFSWSDVFTTAWAIGAALGASSLMAGLVWAWWIVRKAIPAASDWLDLSAEIATELRLAHSIPVLMSGHVGVPVACGVFRPVLLMPPDANSWTRDRRRAVLLHELAHVKRRDCLIQLAAHLAWTIHWFNPFALIAVSQLRSEQERACDDLVLQAGTSSTDYAELLCAIAANRRRVPIPMSATLAIARTTRLEARLKAILDDARQRRPPSRPSLVAGALLTTTLVFGLGAVRARVPVDAITLLPSSAVKVLIPAMPLMPAPTSTLNDPGSRADDAAALAAGPIALLRPAQELSPESAHAFLESCLTCHNSERNVGGLALDKVSLERVGDNSDVWEGVVRKLRSLMHPQAGPGRPDRTSIEAFVAMVETALDRAHQTQSGAAEAISGDELARRIAKFLWSSEPDAALRDAAARGRLNDPSVVQQQLKRMLADTRAAAFLTGFFSQWLHLEKLSKVSPDPAIFPGFDQDLRQAFQRETELFLASQVREDRPLMELLTANYTFVNERLAQHYGIAAVTGSDFKRITFSGSARTGLLGHGSILSVTSFANRTSPVVRGRFVLETILGVTPPPLPPNVPPLGNQDPERPLSMRARMEQHRRNVVCTTCHLQLDPFGFALENFNAIGAWRLADEGGTLDTAVELADGTRFDGPAGLRDALLDRREAIVRTITLKLLAYSTGRPARYSDMPAVRAILWESAPGNFKWLSILSGVIRSEPFQSAQIE